MKVGEETKLIFPLMNSENNLVKYYMYNEEIYDLLDKTYKKTGDSGLHTH